MWQSQVCGKLQTEDRASHTKDDEAKSIGSIMQRWGKSHRQSEWQNRIHATSSKGDKASIVGKRMAKLSLPNSMIGDKASPIGKG